MKIWIENNLPIIAKFLKFVKQNTLNKYKQNRQKHILHKNGKEALLQLKLLFKELGIDWFLVYGTLLGAYRDKDFISHDIDIDIGVFFDDYSQKIEQAMVKNGFIRRHQFLVDHGDFAIEETYEYKGVGIDIFYFKVDQERLIGYGFINEEGLSWDKTIQKYNGLLVREITYPYEGLESIKFLEEVFMVPKNPKKHLASHYGKNFMIKDNNWSPKKVVNVQYLKDKIGVLEKYE
jgi:hypothetical protein